MKKIIAIIILIFIVVVGIFAYNYVTAPRKDQQTFEQVENTVKNIPDISIYNGDTNTGTLVGYTSQMDISKMRDNLSVVTDANRNIKLVIDLGRLTLNGAEYKFRPIDEDRLIDNGSIEGQTNGSDFEANIAVSAVLDKNSEYMLILTLDYENIGKVYYYTRVMVTKNAFVEDQIAFAKQFSSYTMDTDKSKELAQYMEIDDSLLNNSMGCITLANNFNLVAWANLVPDRLNDGIVNLKEVCVKSSGISGTYEMKYQISAVGNNDIVDTYDITETITVWTYDSKQYVLAYERRMNQVWSVDQNTVRNNFIDMGIQEDMDIPFEQSEDGNYIVYEVNGALWLLDTANRQLTNLYTVDSDFKDKTKVLPIKVSDKGVVDFAVYGYSQESSHLGKNGVSILCYSHKNNSVEEKVFAEYNAPVERIDSGINKICYINDSVLYVLLENTLYYVNLETKETGVVVDGLKEGNYAVNSDGDTLTYTDNGSIDKAESLTVLDLSTGKTNTIEAGANKYIKICGYTSSNLIYGVTNKKQVKEEKGRTTFYISTLYILNDNLEEIKKYNKKNIYISDVEITDTVIHLTRVKDGEKIDDDQLLDNTEKTEKAAKASYYDDDKKYRETALSLTYSLDSNLETTENTKVTKKLDSSCVELEPSQAEDKNFYVYACGQLEGVYDNQSDAEKFAKEKDGLVVDGKGMKLWTFEDYYGDEE